jgi:hypothetical protein
VVTPAIVTESRAEAMAVSRSGWLRAWALRSSPCTLLHIISMGLSGSCASSFFTIPTDTLKRFATSSLVPSFPS